MSITFFQEFCTSTQQASSNHYNSSGPISSFYVLSFRQFYKLKYINLSDPQALQNSILLTFSLSLCPLDLAAKLNFNLYHYTVYSARSKYFKTLFRLGTVLFPVQANTTHDTSSVPQFYNRKTIFFLAGSILRGYRLKTDFAEKISNLF